MDRIFVLPVGWNWHIMYLWLLPNEIWPYLSRTITSKPNGIVEVQNRSLGSHFTKSASTLSSNQKLYIFFSIITGCFNDTPSNPYTCRYWALHACTCPWGHAAKCYYWSHGPDSCYCQLHRLEACCHWNFCARQVNRGPSEDHTSSRPCFIQYGPTGSLHKCSDLDGTDKEFVWNEDWPENYQQPALVPWLPCL